MSSISSIVTPNNDPLAYAPMVDTAMATASMATDPHTSSLLSSGHRPLQTTSDPQPAILESFSVLNSGSPAVVGVARDNAMSLSHVLSGLQEEGLAEVLQQQPNLGHGKGHLTYITPNVRV